MHFWNYRLWKSWLDHSLKSAVSEHALTVNMWKHPKSLWNLHESTFIMFFDPSRWSWFGKCLPYFLVKSYWWVLRHWLPMASILLKIARICNYLFKCNYLKNKIFFWIFCSISGIYIKFWRFWNKRWSS